MTESFPLKWPDGWPRTRYDRRERGGKFRKGGENGSLPTFVQGREAVMAELERLGVKSVVISSMIRLSLSGTPIGDPNRTTLDDPGVAVYFTRKGRPHVIAQDAFDTTGCNLRSLALALAAMRQIERHGGGAMMGKAFDGFAALPPPAGSKSSRPWWEVLKYPAAPEEREFLTRREVEARAAAIAKKTHPDVGGSNEAMAEVLAARDQAIAALREGE